MNNRKAKRIKCAKYPKGPFRSTKSLVHEERGRWNRATRRGEQPKTLFDSGEIGTITGFTFISSSLI